MKIAHISDLHFFFPYPSSHLFGISLIGYINAFLRRRNFFITKYLDDCIASLIRDEIEILIITGDFTTTADPKEFLMAKDFLQKVSDAGIKVHAIPGNHDTYTKESFKSKMFYSRLDILPKLSAEKIHPKWDLILLDNTILNKPFRANGSFQLEQKEQLEKILENCKNVIIANHFPFIDKLTHHNLFNSKALKKILKKHHGTVIYLCGHTHVTSYTQMDGNVHIFNSSETTVVHKHKYHQITLLDDIFSYKEVKYHE